ncbi:cytochrome P450 [Mycena vitilis]|nr:cytochrome P450 [Mycena vitilis]
MSNNFQIMALASSQAPSQVLADAVAARLPAWVLTAAIYLPTRAFKAVRTAKYLAHRVGSQAIREKKDAAQQGMDTSTDLYGQLLELNSAGRTKNPLTDDEIIAQTAILTLAGQDTTVTTLSFGLLELAKAPQFQDSLRKICRLYPAEPMTDRVALQETIIPLSESIITSTGEHISQIPIAKGQLILLGIASYHRFVHFCAGWGKDALEFNPARWLDGSATKGEAVGPYANLWRFAVLEMQVFLCALLQKFLFSLPEGELPRTRIANTLMPAMPTGQKGAPLVVGRIPCRVSTETQGYSLTYCLYLPDHACPLFLIHGPYNICIPLTKNLTKIRPDR